jgi:hypothetical protein
MATTAAAWVRDSVGIFIAEPLGLQGHPNYRALPCLDGCCVAKLECARSLLASRLHHMRIEWFSNLSPKTTEIERKRGCPKLLFSAVLACTSALPIEAADTPCARCRNRTTQDPCS